MRRRRFALFVLPALLLGCSVLLDFDRLEQASDAGVGDLAGADLTGADLTGEDLAGADLSGLDLTGVDLAHSCPAFPAGGLSFTNDETNLTGAQSYWLDVGDLNHDGRPDMVVPTNNTSTHLRIFLKDPAGRTFRIAGTIDAGCSGANYAWTSTIGQFTTGDSDPDVIVGCNDQGGGAAAQMFLHKGDGQGGFAAPVPFTMASHVDEARAFDVDRDGKDDLLAIVRDSGHLLIYWGGGSMQTQTPLAIETGADPSGVSARAILPGGDVDLVVSHLAGTWPDMATDTPHLSHVRHVPGQGRMFLPPVRYELSLNGATFGQFTSDLFADVIATANSGELYLLRGKADGTLEAPTQVGTAPLHQRKAVAADLDCDGIDDVAMSHFQTISGPESAWDVVSARKGSATGALSPITTPTFPDGPASGTVGIADFDGDGRLDIAVHLYDATSRVRILWSNPP